MLSDSHIAGAGGGGGGGRCPIILVSGLEEFLGSHIAWQSGGRCTCVRMTVVHQNSAAGTEPVPCAAGTALSGSLAES